MNLKELAAEFRARCVDDGDCLAWDGAVDSSGCPQVRIPGSRKTFSARRICLEADGKKIFGLLATVNCGNKCCLAPEHLVAMTRKQLQKRSGKIYAASVTRNAKLAEARRKTAKLDFERVAQMRAEVGLTTRQAAAKYGVTQSTAQKIMRGELWKDYKNPFAGLMAANDSHRRSA